MSENGTEEINIDKKLTKEITKFGLVSLFCGFVLGVPTGEIIRNKFLENKFHIKVSMHNQPKNDSLLKDEIYKFDH